MAKATIKVSFNVGESPKDCVLEAKRLATMLDCWIDFDYDKFSKIHVQVNKDTDVEKATDLIESYKYMATTSSYIICV